MGTYQVFSEIISKHKWYAIVPDINEQTKLRVQALRIQKGTAKDETIVSFIKKFGYEIEHERKWRKKL